jgi:superfamily II DNA or RNA helicase
MHTLRPYQELLLSKLRSEIATSKRVIGSMATGGGKTAVFINIARNALMKKKTVLILTESRKIFAQISEVLKGSTYEISSKTKNTLVFRGCCYIAMAQTLSRRANVIDQFAHLKDNLLIINDEAHINTATALLEKFENAFLLGFTATPQGKHLRKLYNSLVSGPQPDELVRLGFLSPYSHFARVGASLDKLIIENGEFTEESQKNAFDTPELYKGLSVDLKKFAFKKCMIFCASIAHCEATYKHLTELNFKCVRIHSNLSKEVESSEMFKFKMQDYDICISVGSLTKGFDWPPVDLIVLNRATRSTALFLQIIGRGSRICTGKQKFCVLDYGENYRLHGLWDQDRDWHETWNKVSDKKDGVAAIKLCPKCDFLMEQKVQTCPNCGYVFVPDKRDELPEISDQESELIEITRNWKGRMISSLSPQELAVYARLKNKKAYAIRIAKARTIGYGDVKAEPYFINYFSAAMGYKPAWVHMVMDGIKPSTEINFYDFELK